VALPDAKNALLDCHFHWYPQAIEDGLNRVNGNARRHGADWFDLEGQLARMDALNRRVDVISGAGAEGGGGACWAASSEAWKAAVIPRS
jgi:hypothetical protein